jgi:hypothetical protein
MSSDPRVPEEGPAPQAVEGQPARKPYVRPDFIREEVFETTALACGKINPTIRQCNLVRKNS